MFLSSTMTHCTVSLNVLTPLASWLDLPVSPLCRVDGIVPRETVHQTKIHSTCPLQPLRLAGIHKRRKPFLWLHSYCLCLLVSKWFEESVQSYLSDRSKTTEKVIHLFRCDLKRKVLDKENCLRFRMKARGCYLGPSRLPWSDWHGGDCWRFVMAEYFKTSQFLKTLGSSELSLLVWFTAIEEFLF